ncbi:hypothetical protein MRX96_004378 [Rhipicephalus microplus]
MNECRPSFPFSQKSGLPAHVTQRVNIAQGFVLPWKRSTTDMCDLMNRVIDCNKMLWCWGLQIRDNPRDELGEASIAIIRKLETGFPVTIFESDTGLIALAVLVVVLLEHRCIVAVDLLKVFAKLPAVRSSPEKMSTLKRLTIIVEPDEEPNGVDDLVAFQSFVDDGGVQLRFVIGN